MFPVTTSIKLTEYFRQLLEKKTGKSVWDPFSNSFNLFVLPAVSSTENVLAGVITFQGLCPLRCNSTYGQKELTFRVLRSPVASELNMGRGASETKVAGFIPFHAVSLAEVHDRAYVLSPCLLSYKMHAAPNKGTARMGGNLCQRISVSGKTLHKACFSDTESAALRCTSRPVSTRDSLIKTINSEFGVSKSPEGIHKKPQIIKIYILVSRESKKGGCTTFQGQ